MGLARLHGVSAERRFDSVSAARSGLASTSYMTPYYDAVTAARARESRARGELARFLAKG